MASTIVIFGASGDLTSRKLIPALFRLFQKKRLPAGTQIVGVSRSQFSDEQWRAQLNETTQKHAAQSYNSEDWEKFQASIFYHPADITKGEDFVQFAKYLDALEPEPRERVYYLSTSPRLYESAIELMGRAGLADEDKMSRRIIIEKPFGTDLASARALNESVHRSFKEHQIYRIDHYLGKETVQNMFVLRFANTIFEPLWNRNYIDHVQITVAEEVQVGRRAGYYDTSGILRDMFQNHLLQLMMITAMEAPARFDSNMVRDEKVKVLHSVRPMSGSDFATDTLRGQYDGYLNEEGVPAGSQTATFAAIKLYIDNWRWKGVPFYLRSGKAMSCRTTQIVIQFRQPPHLLFSSSQSAPHEANQLVIQVQPAEGLQMHFQSKVPDAEMKTRAGHFDFRFQAAGNEALPDAYQRLLMDAVNGDASLFARSDEVELAWSIIDPIIGAWNSPAAPPLHRYEPQLWGPSEAQQWMQKQKRNWFDVCPVI